MSLTQHFIAPEPEFLATHLLGALSFPKLTPFSGCFDNLKIKKTEAAAQSKLELT